MKSSSTSHTPISLRGLLHEAVFIGLEDATVRDCQTDPRRCTRESAFAALDPSLEDLDLAAQRGAKIILTERLLPSSLPQCLVPDVRIAAAQVTHEVAGAPTEQLLSVGVLGTHGKTTIGLLIATMLKKVAGSVAYQTSLGSSDGKQRSRGCSEGLSSQSLCQWLQAAVEAGTPASVLEISESMLSDKGIAGLEFDVLVIPGLRSSHKMTPLAVRGLEKSIRAACQQLKKHGLIVYNADDARLNQWIQKQNLPAISYGLDADANVRGNRLMREIGGQGFMISSGKSLMPLQTSLIGDHNARHLLGAVATGYAFGLELHEVIGGVERMERIPGRMQPIVRGQGPAIYIDQADQADRLAVALHAMARHDSRPITVVAEIPEVVDAEAKAAYGRVLERCASKVILTQCRRPTQAGQAAMWEVLDGCERPTAIDLVPNRAVAIEIALRAVGQGDQVLLAGWGANGWTAGEDRSVQTDAEVAEAILERLDREEVVYPIEAYRSPQPVKVRSSKNSVRKPGSSQS